MTKLQEGSELGEISIDQSKYNGAIRSDTRISVQGSLNAPDVKVARRDLQVDRKNSSEQGSTCVVSVVSPKLHTMGAGKKPMAHMSTAYDTNWNRLASKKGSSSNHMKETWQTPFQSYVQKLKDKPQKDNNMATITLNE